MSNLTGTRWSRKTDSATVTVEADAESISGRSNRSLLLRNEATNRRFWGTPEGLHRKYTRLDALDATSGPLTVPVGLSELGNTAAQIINEAAQGDPSNINDEYVQLYSPQQWRAREEQYALDCELIIVHEGSTAYAALGLYSEEASEEFSQRLREHGVFLESSTHWYSAIYPI